MGFGIFLIATGGTSSQRQAAQKPPNTPQAALNTGLELDPHDAQPHAAVTPPIRPQVDPTGDHDLQVLDLIAAHYGIERNEVLARIPPGWASTGQNINTLETEVQAVATMQDGIIEHLMPSADEHVLARIAALAKKSEIDISEIDTSSAEFELLKNLYHSMQSSLAAAYSSKLHSGDCQIAPYVILSDNSVGAPGPTAGKYISISTPGGWRGYIELTQAELSEHAQAKSELLEALELSAAD